MAINKDDSKKMDHNLYMDNSNVWIEGQRVAP